MTILFTSQVPSISNYTDSVPYELGMKFHSNTGGQINAIRFWKAPSETGTHIGKIWNATGTLLASVTFSNETASGWQSQALATPLNIQANTTYVVSVNVNSYYVATNDQLGSSIVNGNLSSVADGSNGVFNGTPGAFPTGSYRNTNYFRDIDFVAASLPTITKTSGDNQTGAAGTALPNPLVVQVKDSAGNPQSGVTVNFAVTSGGGSVSPTSAVTNASGQASTMLTLGAVLGSTLPITNAVSTTAAGVGSVNFSATASPTGNTQVILTTQVPSVPNATDNASYELGLKFRSAKGGQISAIRFWKAASETGTHIGKIWNATGTLLTSVTFSNETASGWQEQLLATPVNIQVNTTYVVSVNANTYYVATYDELASSIVNGDLSSVADGNNGVYNTNPNSFPTSSYRNSNYYRDIAFVVGSNLVKVSGDNQIGATGAALPNALVVQVVNAQNNPQSGVTVSFAVTNGGGSVSPTSVITNASGQASTILTLGSVPTAPGGVVVTATVAGIGSIAFSTSATPANPNPIYLENLNSGTTNWKLDNLGSGEIAGYASATSVNKGESLDIKVSLGQAGQYTIDVYRLGYYGGTGGRLIATSGPLNGTTQAACTKDPDTGLLECNWTTSYVLQVSNNWTSGIYVAKLTDQATGKVAHVWFVVRNDSSNADILFSSAVSTVLAYSSTGGQSLYTMYSIGGQRAFKVSYDAPFSQASDQQSTQPDKPLQWEYNMVRWLESQAYNITYTDSMQIHTNAQSLLNHKVFLSVGHDEYWSKEMRDRVEAARNNGINLGFFSANTCYWRVRFEDSTLAAGQVKPNRVMACYKQDWSLDPVAQQQGASAATNKFRSVQNQRPENALLGVMYGSDYSNVYGGANFVVSNSSDSYYANTGLQNGDQLTLLVGYEWDFVVNNGSSPAGLITLSQSPVEPSSLLPNFDEPPGEEALPANQDFTKSYSARYTASSGAKVFASGSIQWAWGLDSEGINPAREDIRVKQMTVNILADMGAKPQAPNANLIVP
ncbi:N,N-dimethylformamidase beta subunit family domain-containing protein [Nostoc sp. 'Peltigera membranacea cyanobiont' 232]|uniref:N,N-dimethylformamidase beta subunit family domain-containing protein n=1 Tax=Nostoc sp. 'Peltigera membranacea cyanobiont' 232 TaxID=2014531 RepID=UPI000B95772E|nr:N,N-dimethylformamidase beta subunit family domain-containing protein [Nostoc sp. 'Peltigera membranacea cyanobiont' 232]OYE06338.1 Ig domain-containing protein group 1 domain-containing protein [Nostoc sp. 'Peltigera membranacea cyanobiont' 232]